MIWKKVITEQGENVTIAGTLTGTTSSFTNTTTNDTLLLTTTEDSSTAAPVITLKRNSSSPADADYLGQLKFKGEKMMLTKKLYMQKSQEKYKTQVMAQKMD